MAKVQVRPWSRKDFRQAGSELGQLRQRDRPRWKPVSLTGSPDEERQALVRARVRSSIYRQGRHGPFSSSRRHRDPLALPA